MSILAPLVGRVTETLSVLGGRVNGFPLAAQDKATAKGSRQRDPSHQPSYTVKCVTSMIQVRYKYHTSRLLVSCLTLVYNEDVTTPNVIVVSEESDSDTNDESEAIEEVEEAAEEAVEEVQEAASEAVEAVATMAVVAIDEVRNVVREAVAEAVAGIVATTAVAEEAVEEVAEEAVEVVEETPEETVESEPPAEPEKDEVPKNRRQRMHEKWYGGRRNA